MIFLNLEKMFQCAYFNQKGDFIKLSAKTFTDVEQANREFGFADGTPSGEYAESPEGETETVEAAPEAPVNEEVAAEAPSEVASEEVVPVQLTEEVSEPEVETDETSNDEEEVVDNTETI